MKIDTDLKLDIQCFTYYLFKGSLTPRLIVNESLYVERILSDEKLLFECFKVFAMSKQIDLKAVSDEIVTDYILKTKITEIEKTLNKFEFNPFWTDFLKLSKRLIFYKISNNYKMKDFNGLGTDIVPYFAVWTNVIEIDRYFNVLNSEYSLNRASQRFLNITNNFEEWELDQEIY